MFASYLKIAFRNIKKHKGYSFINIAGLAIGLACCILILLYIQFETSWDNYHKDSDRIFRIAVDVKNNHFGNSSNARTNLTLIPTVKENYPQIENAGRIRIENNSLIKHENNIFYENNLMYVDQEFFNIISIPFVSGNSSTALEIPQSVVIPEHIAEKYFGTGNPVGKIINITRSHSHYNFEGKDFTITGVISDPPLNTHLKYSFIASMDSWEGYQSENNWKQPYICYSYIKLVPNINSSDFEKEISKIGHKYRGDLLKEWGSIETHFLQPISGIHLHSHLNGETEAPGDPQYLTIFSVICFLILIIAACNFINLSTARSFQRAKEVGIRKTAGANRLQLMRQFLGDSLLIFLFSVLCSFLIVVITLPLFEYLTGLAFSIFLLFKPFIILTMIGFVVIVGFAAGSYPAFLLSSFNPVLALEGNINSRFKKSYLRRSIVVVQFSISIVLVICTIVIYNQLNFMKNSSLGFEKEQMLIIPVKDRTAGKSRIEIASNELLAHASITGASASAAVPGNANTIITTVSHGNGEPISSPMKLLCFDHDFISVYKIEMAAGRSFSREIITDTSQAILINETAVKAAGFLSPEEAVNKIIKIGGEKKIIGVTKDFHLRGFQNKISPIIMSIIDRLAPYKYISLSVNTQNLKETLAFVKNKWNALYPGNPFEYYFLDADFDLLYHSEDKLGRIFRTFTSIGILIACLGLFGLASFIAGQRTKEIGIRKTLGSSSSGIVYLLSKEFLILVCSANLIAWPVAYFAMNKWLENFAYRIDVGITIFILSGAAALVIALLTVSYQTVKAARANPVDSLRYE